MTDAQKALEGKTVLVTRGEGQAGKLSKKLSQFGAKTIEIPVIHFAEPESWEPLDQALASIGEYDWIIFASANAVRCMLDRATNNGIMPRTWLSARETGSIKTRFATIGPATSEELQRFGLVADFQPVSFVAENFVEEFAARTEAQGVRVLWPRTNVGRTLIADELTDLGARVDIIEVYQTVLPPDAGEIARKLGAVLTNKEADVLTLASSQTVKHFEQLLKLELDTDQIEEALSTVLIATIGPITSSTARQIFGRVDIESSIHTVDGLVDSIVEHYGKQ